MGTQELLAALAAEGWHELSPQEWEQRAATQPAIAQLGITRSALRRFVSATRMLAARRHARALAARPSIGVLDRHGRVATRYIAPARERAPERQAPERRQSRAGSTRRRTRVAAHRRSGTARDDGEGGEPEPPSLPAARPVEPGPRRSRGEIEHVGAFLPGALALLVGSRIRDELVADRCWRESAPGERGRP